MTSNIQKSIVQEILPPHAQNVTKIIDATAVLAANATNEVPRAQQWGDASLHTYYITILNLCRGRGAIQNSQN